MDLSKLEERELIAAIGGIVLLFSLLFLELVQVRVGDTGSAASRQSGGLRRLGRPGLPRARSRTWSSSRPASPRSGSRC